MWEKFRGLGGDGTESPPPQKKSLFAEPALDVDEVVVGTISCCCQLTWRMPAFRKKIDKIILDPRACQSCQVSSA